MALVERDPSDRTLVTHLGGAEITVRPEASSGAGNAPVVLLRLVSPMFDSFAVAYLGPVEATALARALLAAAEAADGRPGTTVHGWRNRPLH
ncbi:hypothetical protein [Pseudofrankia inefficax]|uniref:Uncharacterized protein n=1 Tax=Pseudofrankia inefficax (strain DSM 45817 / CECT 9037 / DDB 130130 / EuI1c) TaxID=298654 RepID=E3IUY1_PSEI1|nr:hypothetical protein [Pseudofrankia inefficax]ADP78861.1 hypothetical protein FraEuI1c_0783 [Pseudofrankia inefficax]